MNRSVRCAVVFAFLVLCVFLGAASAFAAVTERESVSSTGEEGNNESGYSSVSADGRFVAFESFAKNLVAGDTNDRFDAFVRDRLTGYVERVSVSSAGAQADGGNMGASISPDGRYVAFYSDATNLVADDTNGVSDVFRHDRETGITERVSVSSTGEQGNGDCAYPTMSADGRYVAFQSMSSNLDAGDANGDKDVFLRDMVGGTTLRISNNLAGMAGNGTSSRPYISSDASCVAFGSTASDLVSDDTNGNKDVFVFDTGTVSIECVSVSSTGAQGNSTSEPGVMSADGRYVAFQSIASTLVGGDTNAAFDVFLHDRLTGITELVSVSSSGEQGNLGSYEPGISADGRYLAFKSFATNLVPGDTNGTLDAFFRDRISGATERVSVSSTGEQSNAECHGIRMSADGGCVTYWSVATNLVPGDTNGLADTFLRDRFGNGYPNPQDVSLSASVGTPGAAPFTLTTQYRDANGFADIRRCYLLVNDSLAQANAALLYYDRTANKLYLKNDANTIWGTGYAPGTNVTLENSQCYLYVKDTTAGGSDNNLTVKWSIALKAPFSSKLLKGYMYVQDSAGHTDGWEQMATFHNVKPEALSITPSTGQIPTDTWVTLTSFYRDMNGYEDLRKCYLLVNDKLVQSNAMFIWYDRASNKVYLKNDANTSWGTGYAPGTDTLLENSQCYVRVKGVTVTGSGNNFAVAWQFVLKSATMGSKNLYSWIYATDSKLENSGYKKVGTHFTPVAPVCLSLSPNSGNVNTGLETPFMALYEDTNGWADIYKIYIQLSVTSSQANAVLLMYDAKQNKVFLRNDAGTSWGSGGVPGSAAILENSQCKVNMASFGPPPWSVTDTQLQVSWPIELKPSQIGKRLCERLFVQDNALLNSGWHVFGYVRAE